MPLNIFTENLSGVPLYESRWTPQQKSCQQDHFALSVLSPACPPRTRTTPSGPASSGSPVSDLHMFTITTVSERSNDNLEVLCDGDDDSPGGRVEEEGGSDHQEGRGEGGGIRRPAGE